MPTPTPDPPCPLCGRPLVPGPSVDRHHWVPRSQGGHQAETLHRVCHRMLHRVFSDAELAERADTPDKARAHPDMARFIAWVRRKPADYVDWPEQPGRHGRRR
ncbi:MAG: HNH endonuclease [Rhodobacterales bacterium]|nr:HNH endonuclease [Rhodobacterales bacterium]